MIALIFFCLTGVSAVTPIEKVITLLTELQTDVQKEGEKEAATYKTFSCFCNDKTNAKSQAISDGEASVQGLTATVEQLTGKQGALSAEITGLQNTIAESEAALAKAT